ncbi:hypothetical protein GCM10010246_74370 [Streptomyces cuspidosporus]|uniref:Uncharacterized protein n=1 Tax=Streptomyces cuspidosporus TaxID=66882 RepID=A0ABN3H5C1_9ACTN
MGRRGPGAGAGDLLHRVLLRGVRLRSLVLGCVVLRDVGVGCLVRGDLLLRGLLLRGLLLRGLLLRYEGLLVRYLLGRALRLRPALRLGLLPRLGPGGRGLLIRGLLVGGLRRRAHRRRRAVGARADPGGGAGARGAPGEGQPGTVARVPQMHGRPGADLHLLDPPALHIRAIGTAVVLDDPTAPAPAHGGMPPGHPGVVQHHVALRIASDPV